MQQTAKMVGRMIVWGLLATGIVIGLRPLVVTSADKTMEKAMTFNKLTPDEERVIVHKGTEPPFSGKYYQFSAEGAYTCKRCGTPLYRSTDKFDAGCGWPSFDAEIPGAVKRTLDADGRRTEITCANCGAHLGHVFEGEGFTPKNIRHCVNSISMNFMPASETQAANAPKVVAPSQKPTTETAYFAGGCFWGTEYLLEKAEGVISVRVGYMGGRIEKPTYQQVCDGRTGHAETAEIVFDPTITNYEKLARLFFEIHDPTQVNRQGPDIGDQYRSAIFYVDDTQKQVVTNLIDILKNKGYNVVTESSQAGTFWPAEDYHQDYYDHNGKQPYCHFYQKRF
jgi:peptide methionine sulfoxide reductase msrA/msrB